MESSGPSTTSLTRRQLLTAGLGVATGAALSTPRRSSAQGGGSVLRVAISETRDPLDPAVYYGTSDMVLPLNTQETLIRYKMGTYQLEPNLAESWQVKDDGRTFVFKLRPGVKYIDGTRLNAESVKFEIDRAIKINQGPDWMLADFVDKTTADSEQQLTITLKTKLPGFLHNLAGAWAIRFQSPAAYQAHQKDGDMGQAWAVSNTAGTGPYKIESFDKESRVVLVKNDTYWRGWQGKHIDRVIINVIKEQATVRLQLEAGDLDVAFVPLKPADYAALEKNATLTVGRFPSGTHYMLQFKCNQPPTDNQLVRQAISHAFNYDQVINRLYGGNGQRIGPLCLGLEGDSPKLHTVYRFDLEKAKGLLAKAGVKPGVKMKALSRPVDPNLRLVYELFQSDLRKIGVELEVAELAGAPWREQWLDPKADWNLLASYWTPDTIDPGGTVYPLYKCEGYLDKASVNRSRWCNERVDSARPRHGTVHRRRVRRRAARHAVPDHARVLEGHAGPVRRSAPSSPSRQDGGPHLRLRGSRGSALPADVREAAPRLPRHRLRTRRVASRVRPTIRRADRRPGGR